MTIFVKSLIIPSLIANLSCKVAARSKNLPLIIKLLVSKGSYSSFSTHFYNQQPKYITSLEKKARCFVGTNNSYNLSKTMSGKGDENINVNYSDVVKAQKDKSILIIDVRENYEIEETGKLPGSIHIPMAEVTNVFQNCSNQEFEKKFNRKKPAKDTQIVLSCRSGRRSAMVQHDIQELGYKNVQNYVGGWLDWESHQKE